MPADVRRAIGFCDGALLSAQTRAAAACTRMRDFDLEEVRAAGQALALSAWENQIGWGLRRH